MGDLERDVLYATDLTWSGAARVRFRFMHEWGVRAALGAQRSDLLRLVLSQSARFAGAGVLLGLLIAYWASRWIQPLLFQQSARDPIVYAGVGVLLLAVALIGGGLPARRAARIDPSVALRSE